MSGIWFWESRNPNNLESILFDHHVTLVPGLVKDACSVNNRQSISWKL